MTLALIAAAVLVAAYVRYATLVTRRNKVREAMSSVDVHLTQRHDLVPNIVALASRYMAHERELLGEVSRLRESASAASGTTPGALAQRFAAEGQLSDRVGQLFVRMEAYPDLKSAGPLAEAQRTWVEVEAQITAARRFYNAAVNQLNNAVQVFPGSIIAAVAGIGAMPFFEATSAAREAPSAAELMGRRS